jgi:sirohydrochlorin ferrochelatase
VAEVVRERERLGQSSSRPSERASARAIWLTSIVCVSASKVVALVVHEDLRLVLQAAEGRRVDDAVAVPLELRPGRRDRLR